MKMTPNAAGLAADTSSSPALVGRIASQDGRSQRSKPLMRKFEIAHLDPLTLDIHEATRLAPALPPFEDAFSAIGRGAILQTDRGPCAIEDLYPGDRVVTESHGLQPLLWKGSITIVPGAQNARPEMGTMTRVTAEALGLGRPSADLVLGPSARLCHKAPGVRTLTGSDAAFIPVRDFIDSCSIIELTPIAPVHCYQLGFARHCRISVNGIEIESLHPGAPHALGLRQDMQALLMTLFPHMQSLSAFGTMLHPRLRLRDLDLFDVA